MTNYTEEQTKYMVDMYLQAEDKEAMVEYLSEHFNKPKKSVIGKLSKEKVYQKKVYLSKTGEPPVTKKELIHHLSELVGADPERLQGLEKAPKLELQYLISFIEK
jgi:hypothetical protein